MLQAIGNSCAIAAIVVGLSACQSAIYPDATKAHIAQVTVHSGDKTVTPQMAATIQQGLQLRLRQASRSGAPKCLTILLQNYHKKNPALALVIGDQNRMAGQLTIVDASTRKTEATASVLAQDSYALNGVIGAAQAMIQKHDEVEARVLEKFQFETVRRLYGDKVANGDAAAGQSAMNSEPQASTAGCNPSPHIATVN
jgi:hypothetical protein